MPSNRRSVQRDARRIRSQRLAAARTLGTHTDAEWRALVDRFGGRCVRCGRTPHAVEKDHIKPLYRGGGGAIDNLQPVCAWCNCSKGPESFNWVAYRDEHGFDE